MLLGSIPTMMGHSSLPWREGRSERRSGPWSCCRPSMWKGEGKGKMFPLTSWRYSLAPGHNRLSSDVAADLPRAMASSCLSDSNHAPQQEDSLPILPSMKERLFSCNPATDVHGHILTHPHRYIPCRKQAFTHDNFLTQILRSPREDPWPELATSWRGLTAILRDPKSQLSESESCSVTS